VNNTEQPWHNKEFRSRPSKFEGFLDRIGIFHPQGKHKTQDCDRLQGFTYEVLKTTKKADQEKMLKDPKGDFPKAHKEVNYIYCGSDSYESRRKQKLIAREVIVVSPATPEYLKWSEIPITFNHSDHLDFVPKPRRYPLIVSPIIALRPSRALFHGIVPGVATTPIGQITLPVTFETRENFCTENL
jgi:hypothetical protein